MAQDGANFSTLRVDGGMVVNDLVVQFLSDLLGMTVERPRVTETTALGVAFLAGLRVGIYDSLEQISELWQSEHKFEPQMDEASQNKLYQGWLDAVRRVRSN
jgi:glycerol kinase